MAVEVRFQVRERDLDSALDALMSLPVVGAVTADLAPGVIRETKVGGWTSGELVPDVRGERR